MKLIVALDYVEMQPALSLIEQLDPTQCALKVGLEMYTRFGAHWVLMLVKRGFKVFLDLKFHDIPHTVAQACKAAADLGVWMINVHALGGPRMLLAAREALLSYSDKPLLIGVTVLTSMEETDLVALGMMSSLKQQTLQLAKLVQDAGLDGVVCSALMAAAIKEKCGSQFLTVTPGIRLPEDDVHDQKQVMTPQQAIASGCDYFVMGRSITTALDPYEKVTYLLKSIQ